MKTIGVAIDELFVKHDNGYDHPESPDRLYAINDMLHQIQLIDKLKLIRPRDAKEVDILGVHEDGYYQRIKSTKGKERVFLDQDTSTNTFSYDAAIRASGAVLECIDNITDNIIDAGFCLLRPPGHHAEMNKAMGFCLFNHVAVGANYLINKGLERVLIVDYDVHHGNGTQHIFENNEKILFFSTHQYPFYPGTGSIGEVGTDKGKGYTVNIPLSSGLGDDEYLSVYNELLLPIADQFKPQFVLVSAGFDAHKMDPLGGMNLSSEFFAKITRLLLDIAVKYSNNNIVFLLEGGYDLNALWESTKYVFEELLDINNTDYKKYSSEIIQDVLVQIKKIHKEYWTFN